MRAPYNFVPFSNKILLRYASEKELPPHDRIDPDLKSGEIHLTMTAETPVFVSDGHKDQNGDPDPHFFKGSNGKHMIPGSTIRGMVRENMQILGFGLIRPGEDLEDIQIYFRDMASGRDTATAPRKEYYKGALDVETRKLPSGERISIPRRVKAAMIRNENGTYYLNPISSGYLRVSRNHPDVAKFVNKPAQTILIGYSISTGGVVTNISPRNSMTPGMKRGILLYTGKPVGKKQNSLYIFPEADGEPIKIEEKDILSYRADWEDRKNSLKAYYEPEFWNLPGNGEEKPVFYAFYDGHIYLGMSLFLRIGYKYALSKGLPQNHRDKVENELLPLDYPYSVLGYADEKKSYKSRVSFGDMELQGNEGEEDSIQVILGEPKPSFYLGYVKDGTDYNEEKFELRGYKQYWLKDTKNLPTPEKLKVASKLRPLPAKSVFSGVIRFKNLHEDELGLLLWCLKLKEGCYQSIGMGKPYGFGRMKPVVDDLLEYDFAAMYRPGGLSASPVSKKDQMAQYIKQYDTFASDKLSIRKPKKSPSIESRDEINDFFYLRSTIRKFDETSYMELEDYRNLTQTLETVKTIREKNEETPAIPVAELDWRAKLLQLNNRL